VLRSKNSQPFSHSLLLLCLTASPVLVFNLSQPQLSKRQQHSSSSIMAARAAAVKVKADLRVILKYAKSLPSSSANAMHDHVLSQFKLGSHETDKQKIKVLRWQARDAASLVDSTMKRRELIDIYAGEKMSQVERMKLSAHRVGEQTLNNT
jgi:hypothetical protein